MTYQRFKIEEIQSTPATLATVATVQTTKNPQSVADVASVAGGKPETAICAEGDYEERAALIESGANVPREWAEGLARLIVAQPIDGFSAQRWRQVIDDGGRFLDQWGSEAARQGWRAVDVFGAIPAAPAARYDGMGLALLINGGTVERITGTTATIRTAGGSAVVYMRRDQENAVSLWELVPR
jgi:hypothetical protein